MRNFGTLAHPSVFEAVYKTQRAKHNKLLQLVACFCCGLLL
jgi:hypothetical protein